MRFRKSDPPENPEETEIGTGTPTDAAAALALAEAEAAAAEATAASARARAEQIRLDEQNVADDTEAAAAIDDAEDDAGTTEETEEVAEEDTIVQSEPPRRVGPALRWAAATLTVLLIGALVTVSVLMVIQHRDVEAEQRQASEYAAAARQGVVTLMSLDFTSVDEDVQRIIENSTGDFKKEFEAQAKDFATVAKESKVVTEASATAAAVESMTDLDAVVLVTATSTVTNAAGAKQEPRNWRLTVNVSRDGDQIKMSKVEFAP